MLPIQHTIRYKTYLKQSLVEALEAVFAQHPDELLQDTKVRLENSFEETDYPTIVVNYHESRITDAGVGHIERIKDPATNQYYKRQRKFYRGTLEFTISALSNLDRDLISDAFIQTVMMGDVAAYTNLFLSRVYDPEEFERLQNSVGLLGTAYYYNMINIGNQDIIPGGESAVPAPWAAEDVLVYQTSYSMAVFGEVISLPPQILYQLITKVRPFPYVGGVESVPTGTVDTAPWITQG